MPSKQPAKAKKKSKPHQTPESSVSASRSVSPAATKTKAQQQQQPFVDPWVAWMAALLVLYALVLLVDFNSDWHADVIFQCLGIARAVLLSFGFADPASPLASHLFNLRIATRVVRPVSHVHTGLAKFAALGATNVQTIFVAANALHDSALVLVGAAILFEFTRQDLFRAFFRECHFVFAVTRFAKSFLAGDALALASCVAEVFATNSFLATVVMHVPMIPPRVVAMLTTFIASQKLAYLF